MGDWGAVVVDLVFLLGFSLFFLGFFCDLILCLNVRSLVFELESVIFDVKYWSYKLLYYS